VKINRYRIETGMIYEWDSKNNAYICCGSTLAYTKKELNIMSKEMIEEYEDEL
jgi:chloramphenicol O-acetyltransferase